VKLRRVVTWIVVLVLAGIVALQFVPVDRTNPPAPGTIREAPADVMAVLRRACFDCHSNETRWPWYAYVAPVSWLVAHDVEEGREHLNFSEWTLLDPPRREAAIEEILEEVERDEMPLPAYRLVHPGARLDERAKGALAAWAGATGGAERGEPEGD
jgi:hypothetical protein